MSVEKASIPAGKIFYVLRHGQTGFNGSDIAYGTLDGPMDHRASLSHRGLVQGFLASDVIKLLDPPPTHIISSALSRAAETAIMAGRPADIVDARLNERHMGNAEGIMSETAVKHLSEEDARARGIQTREEHRRVVVPALTEHLKTHEAPLFVVHEGTFRRMLEGLGLGRAEIKNGEIVKFMALENNHWTVESVSSKEGKLVRKSLAIESAPSPIHKRFKSNAEMSPMRIG